MPVWRGRLPLVSGAEASRSGHRCGAWPGHSSVTLFVGCTIHTPFGVTEAFGVESTCPPWNKRKHSAGATGRSTVTEMFRPAPPPFGRAHDAGVDDLLAEVLRWRGRGGVSPPECPLEGGVGWGEWADLDEVDAGERHDEAQQRGQRGRGERRAGVRLGGHLAPALPSSTRCYRAPRCAFFQFKQPRCRLALLTVSQEGFTDEVSHEGGRL